jgi:uncharacterized membrane protein YeiH
MIHIIEYIGTFAFAISGIRLASVKEFDLFGAFIVGFATAVGGGTARDLFLGLRPFWMLTPSYIICTAAALLFVIIFKRVLIHLEITFFIFDTIGLGLFTLVGLEKTLALGYPFWTCVIMGMVTGAGGGIMRDILINEVPLIFRKEIYALACILGGVTFTILYKVGIQGVTAQLATSAAVILTRVIAVAFHIRLPILRGRASGEDTRK